MSVDTALQITQAVLSGLKAIHEKKLFIEILNREIFFCVKMGQLN